MALMLAWPLLALLETGAMVPTLLLSGCAGFVLIGSGASLPAFAQAARSARSFRRCRRSRARRTAPDRLGPAAGRPAFALLALVFLLSWPGLVPGGARLHWCSRFPCSRSPCMRLCHRVAVAAEAPPKRCPRAALAPASRRCRARRRRARRCRRSALRGFAQRSRRSGAGGALRRRECARTASAAARPAHPADAGGTAGRPACAAPLIARGVDLTRPMPASRPCWRRPATAGMDGPRRDDIAGQRRRFARHRFRRQHAAAPRRAQHRPCGGGAAARCRAHVDAINGEHLSPLSIACGSGNWRLARFLIEHGARRSRRARAGAVGGGCLATTIPAARNCCCGTRRASTRAAPSIAPR